MGRIKGSPGKDTPAFFRFKNFSHFKVELILSVESQTM